MLDLSYQNPKPKVISGARHDWELVIGMEIHAQVASNAKLFSGASTQVGSEPNSNVAFVDAAMPGMLPVINEFCIEQAVKSGLGLKAQINLRSAFDRKNYFYPDLPQGYQISQLYHPIVGEGEVLVELSPGVARRSSSSGCPPRSSGWPCCSSRSPVPQMSYQPSSVRAWSRWRRRMSYVAGWQRSTSWWSRAARRWEISRRRSLRPPSAPSSRSSVAGSCASWASPWWPSCFRSSMRMSHRSRSG